MTQNIVTRFAPSPTGRLHLGHAYSALLAHDRARAAGGQFLLRIENIDQGRCRAEFFGGIYEDLRWLGLNWDGDVLLQSQRSNLYATTLNQLRERSLVYRCWCTRAEIMASAGAPQGDEGTIYPGTCKGRDDRLDGRPCCWRLDVEAAFKTLYPHHSREVPRLTWHDSVIGTVCADPRLQGDVVIARKDAATSYHLAVTVDDADQGVTDVVRGRDLLAATDIHRLLQALLGLPTPRYHHHALLLSSNGDRLAKRHNAPSIAALRAGGASPKDVVSEMRAGRFPFGFHLEEA
jgi:glutamyl-Q tRNA(Asp) synthetase